MHPSFIPRLVNGPFEDPGLYISLAFCKRALLLDLGDLSSLSAGDLLKTTHVFVTHTHMDHFAGFDQLLRILLGRGKSLHLFGPNGFLKNVQGKLQGYTWNLVRNYKEGLNITATEITPQQRVIQKFRCVDGFEPSSPVVEPNELPFAYKEPNFSVQTTILDHQISTLAFVVQERFHINILNAPMKELGLSPGPWLSLFKNHLFNDASPDTLIQVQCVDAKRKIKNLTIGDISRQITRITPGQKIAYVADAVYSDKNAKKIISIVNAADHLFIEAAFLERDRHIAKNKNHLTAHQAGTLARQAQVRKFSIFHHSPRYIGEEHLLRKEADLAFSGH